MSDKKEDPLNALEDLRLGLQYLDNEEENLMILKNHLTKIKKIREEQIRKDSIVEVLRERVAALEKELATATRQSTDIQEILTERISFLESALKEKDDLEFKYTEVTRYSESLSEQNVRLIADLKTEIDRNNECKQTCDQKDIEITKCRAETSLERQKVAQLQILFETFKSELIHKEDLLSAQHRSHVDHDGQLNQALNIANATIEDLSQQLNKSEEKVGRLMAELSFSESAVSVSKKDLQHFDKELKLWKEMYAELEAVLLKVKGQLLLAQQSHENEMTSLRAELEASKTTSARFKQELNEVHTMLESIAQDVKMIHTLDQQHQATHRSGNGTSNKLHNAQIMAIALSLQKTVSGGGSNVLFNISTAGGKNKRHAHGSGSSSGETNDSHSRSSSNNNVSSSLVVGIQADIAVIVHNVCDMIYRIFAQEEEESDLKSELRQKAESAQSNSAYCLRLENSITELQEELRKSDEAVKLLVDYFAQGRLVLSKASSISSSVADEVSSDVFGGSDYLSNGSPSSVKAAATPTASAALRESIHAISSEARALLLDSLYNSLRSSLHSMLLMEQEKTDILKRLQSNKLQYNQDREGLIIAHDKQVTQLERDIAEMRQQCDEAVIAVRFADYEAQQEIARIRSEADRERRTSSGKGSSLSGEMEELRSQLSSYQTRYTQVTLCLEHTLQYMAELKEQWETLQSVYGLSTGLYHKLALAQATLVSEIHTLSHTFNDVWEDDSGRLILHAAGGGGRGALSRPEASSRRQRYSKYHPSAGAALSTSPGSSYTAARHRRHYSHHHITLRSLVIMVLAANRFRRFRVEGRRLRGSSGSGGSNNLLAVAATSAKLDSPKKYQHQVDTHEFVLLYPAFPLPSVRILTTASAESVVGQLLHAAECRSPYLSDVSALDSGSGLLDDIKLKRHQFVWWKEIAGLNELYSIERQLSHLNQKLQEDQLLRQQQQQQTRHSPPKSPSTAHVGRSTESNGSLHILHPPHTSSPGIKHHSPSTQRNYASSVSVNYRYSGNGGPSGVVVKGSPLLDHSTSNFTSNSTVEEARDSSVMMAMLNSSAVDFNLSQSTWRGLNDTYLVSSTRVSGGGGNSSSSSSGSGSHNDHDIPSGMNDDEEDEGHGSSYDDFDADLRAIAEAKYVSPYPVFHDTSASDLVNDTTSNEILEIYSDIGRLTGKLKSNNRLSSTT